jgi:hypothetical protein
VERAAAAAEDLDRLTTRRSLLRAAPAQEGEGDLPGTQERPTGARTRAHERGRAYKRWLRKGEGVVVCSLFHCLLSPGSGATRLRTARHQHHGRARWAIRADSATGITAGALGPGVAARAPPSVQSRIAEEGGLAAVTAMDDSALHGGQLHNTNDITFERREAGNRSSRRKRGSACGAPPQGLPAAG